MFLQDLFRFLKRQKRNFKVILVQRIERSITRSMSMQYRSLFVVELGASVGQLGLITSLASLVNSIFALPFGWLVDMYSRKKMVLVSMVVGLFAPLIYVLAWNWTIVVPAVVLTTIQWSLGMLAANVIIADSLRNEDRATGLALMKTFATIPSMISLMIAAYIVTAFGGISVEGIRPLFWIMFFSQIVILIYVFATLEEHRPASSTKLKVKSSFLHDFLIVIKEGTALKRVITCQLLDRLNFGMILPYIALYAVKVKDATPFILGLTGVATSLGTILFTLPIGKLADKIGRKRAVYTVAKPLYYLSSILLILAPNPWFLLIPFFLRSMDAAFVTVWQALQVELVPAENRGRWNSIITLFTPITGIPAPIIGSLLWSIFNPAVIFIVHIVLDVCVFLPIFISIPETLSSSSRE